jgi:hypothetical protein
MRSEKMIYKIIEQLKIAEYDHHQAKEKLQRKEDSLHLHTDWNALKAEEGITNQRQREARIREITREEREQAFKTQLEQDHLRRVYHAMLHEQPTTHLPINKKTGEKKGVEMDDI